MYINAFMKRLTFILGVVLTLTLASCNASKEIVYLQDNVINTPEQIAEAYDIKVQPGDEITIYVSCKEPQLAALFSLLQVHRSATGRTGSSGGMGSSGVSSGSGYSLPYTIDSNGNIDFPILGELHVGGMTRYEIAQMVKHRLISEDLVNDPIVTVQFANLHFVALGEVGHNGVFSITTDQITLLEAIAMAGDLTIHGKRDRVMVIREENGMRKTYCVDLRSTDLFKSPAYMIQQNDVIYVEPNHVRAGQSTINENNWKSVGMWMSLASFLMSLSVFIFKR